MKIVSIKCEACGKFIESLDHFIQDGAKMFCQDGFGETGGFCYDEQMNPTTHFSHDIIKTPTL